MENKLDKVLDILNKFEFFYGQRGGRELWADKPAEVQNQDITDFVNNIKYIKDFLDENIILPKKELHEMEENVYQVGVILGKKFGGEETAKKYSEMVTKFILELFKNARISGSQKDLLLKRNKKLAEQFGVEIKE